MLRVRSTYQLTWEQQEPSANLCPVARGAVSQTCTDRYRLPAPGRAVVIAYLRSRLGENLLLVSGWGQVRVGCDHTATCPME